MSMARMNVSFVSFKWVEGYCHRTVTLVRSAAMRTRSVAVLTLAVALAGAGSPPSAAAGPSVPVADHATPAAGPSVPVADHATPAAGTTTRVGSASAVDRLLAGMTLPQKVGQLFTVYAYGADANAPAAADAATNRRLYGVDTPAQVVSKYHLGGVIYFAWTNSLQNPRQVTALSNGLQAASTGVPLMISTDQESGVVSRLPAPATQFPGNMALGAGRNVVDAFTAAQITGREL